MNAHTITREQFLALVLIAYRLERNALRLSTAAESSQTVAEVRENLFGLASDIREASGLEAITRNNLEELKAKASS